MFAHRHTINACSTSARIVSKSSLSKLLRGSPKRSKLIWRTSHSLSKTTHRLRNHLLGLYDGIPLTERGDTYSGVLPDRILVFRNPLVAACETEDDLLREVRITVVHEIAHHFGIHDDRLDELGYA